MLEVLTKLKAQYEADLAKLLQMEKKLREDLDTTVGKIFSFRGAIEAVSVAQSQATPATPTPEATNVSNQATDNK
jgi:hypothetical protein